MNIKVGDKVRFLNDVGGGIVSKVIDRFKVMVENDYGFDVPVSIKEVVVIEQADEYTETVKDTKPVIENNNQTSEEPIVDLSHIFYPKVDEDESLANDINVFLAFVPQKQPGNSDLNVFLINDSNYNVLYSIINRSEQGITFSNAVGVLEANTKEQTETMALSSLNQVPEYIIHLIFYKKGNFNKIEPLEKSIKINPVKFYKEKAYGENDFFNEDAILIPVKSDKYNETEKLIVSEEDIKKALMEKETKQEKPVATSRKQLENELLEIDLHIHELLDDFRGLSNSEMLEVQMNHFKLKLDDCIKNGPKKVVIIHGVGNGVLKLEVRKELDKKSKVLQYHDASFKEYGYGATMVKIK